MLAFGEPLTSFADNHYASVTAEFDIRKARQKRDPVLIPENRRRRRRTLTALPFPGSRDETRSRPSVIHPSDEQ